MKMLPLVSVACLLLTVPASAMSDEDCAAMWKLADANNDDHLTDGESNKYIAMMRLADKPMGADGVIKEDLFFEHCMADVFTLAKIDKGAPLEGANSFTESQALDRIIAAGLSPSSSLTKDEKGIWRGTAQKDGATVIVVVDFMGNVVSQ